MWQCRFGGSYPPVLVARMGQLMRIFLVICCIESILWVGSEAWNELSFGGHTECRKQVKPFKLSSHTSSLQDVLLTWYSMEIKNQSGNIQMAGKRLQQAGCVLYFHTVIHTCDCELLWQMRTSQICLNQRELRLHYVMMLQWDLIVQNNP